VTDQSRHRSLREQWHAYDDRPPVARWTSRISMILGMVLAVVAFAAAAVGAAALFAVLLRAMF
jgi:hypothetical protein